MGSFLVERKLGKRRKRKYIVRLGHEALVDHIVMFINTEYNSLDFFVSRLVPCRCIDLGHTAWPFKTIFFQPSLEGSHTYGLSFAMEIKHPQPSS